ncbi:MAG: C4-dicarboxylate TRAP transporter substrate-binding protein [Spirochaetaceae bacterium]|nr:C4-dicarboxylate TRAP transporter substrate-binding protein [Spirochaetaceae bacterium]
MKKRMAILVTMLALSATVVFASGNKEASDSSTKQAVTTVQIGFGNSLSEPLGQALVKWQSLVAEQGDGSLKIELFPDSQLGSKSELIDSMLLGEPVVTLADGAFYADYGVNDFGIVFGPFLFDSWEQCWTLTKSDWYADQSAQLEAKGLKLLTSDWMYGDRHTLTVEPVKSVADLKGLKLRVPSNKIQSVGMDTLGATSTGMALSDVYQALQTKTIDGAENPLSVLYGRKLQEVAKYLILDAHVKNFTTWVCSADFFNSLTPAQQQLLMSTGDEAGLYNNTLQEASDGKYLQLMKDDGVEVTEMTPEMQAEFKAAALPFYDLGDEFGWSPNLYSTVRKAMGAE